MKHPGAKIRAMIVPEGTTITEVAAKLGIGRPALSNMLNGNASLSWDLALKIEQAYGIDGDDLMKLQWEFDSWCARHGE